jgi:hypothetical protein
MTEKMLEKHGGNKGPSECGDGDLVARRDHGSHQATQ